MRLDLAERLRCPQDHAPTPLVVVARVKLGSDLREGFAGCMVCRLEARIIDGDLRFDAVENGPAVAHDAPPDLERVIALLGLSEPGGAVLLTGRYALLAAPLSALVDVAVVVMGAAVVPRSGDQVASVLGLSDRVPFTDGTFRAVAIDAAASPTFARDAVRAVAAGGRVLAAATLPLTDRSKEIARDAIEWVAEREGDVATVELRRG